MPTALVNQALALATMAAQAGLVLGVLYLWLGPKTDNFVVAKIGRHGLALGFVVGLSAMLLSLYYSEIIGFPPCILCWYQRIFMYPQVFLLGLALAKKERVIIDYALLLILIGATFALYHNYIYYGGVSILPCDAYGLGESCTQVFVKEFGYITIPLMSLTGFLLLGGLLKLQKIYDRDYRSKTN